MGGLRIGNPADGTVTPLSGEYDNFPVWPPRGDLIAFVRHIHGDFEIFTSTRRGFKDEADSRERRGPTAKFS